MTIQDIHIGIDLRLKTLKHNLLGRLLPEEKDFVINNTILSLVHTTAESARHSIINVESYADISNYYNVLEPLLLTTQLVGNRVDPAYVEAKLPKYLSELTKKGDTIIAKMEYLVEDVGNINTILNAITPNSASFKENDVFMWYPGLVKFKGTPKKLNLYKDITYKIIIANGVDFTTCGAANNNIDTVFTCTINTEFDITNSTNSDGLTVLDPISFTPSAWDGIILKAIKDFSLYEYISANAIISTKNYINPGTKVTLEVGTKYKIVEGGAFVNLTTLGADNNTTEAGYIFTCTKRGVPIWANNSTAIIEVLHKSPIALVKPQDIGSFLNHVYGTTISRPLATFMDGHLRVYDNTLFNVLSIELTYVRVPRTVNYLLNQTSDLNINLHPTIVNLSVQDIISTNNPQLYQIADAQTKKNIPDS